MYLWHGFLMATRRNCLPVCWMWAMKFWRSTIPLWRICLWMRCTTWWDQQTRWCWGRCQCGAGKSTLPIGDNVQARDDFNSQYNVQFRDETFWGTKTRDIVQREFYAYICLENVERSNWPNISHYGKGICEKFWQQHVDGQSSPQDLISYHHNPVGMYEWNVCEINVEGQWDR